MAHIYIAYKRADELRVGRIVAALEQHGLDIWWDRELPAAESFQQNLETRLQEAGCVVVFWSKASTQGDNQFVLDEARRGLSRKVLVAVLLDDATIPLGFGEIQAVDLRHWKGKASDPFLMDLVEAIRAKLEGRAVPPPIGPKTRVRRILARSALSGISVAALMTFSFNAFGVASRVCTMPGMQPGLSDGCGALGLGNRPSRQERLAWERLPRGSCEGLRSHIRTFPEGAYRAEAADLLAARRVQTQVRWNSATRNLALFEPAAGSAPTASLAQARALQIATPEAERLCRLFGSGTLFRFVKAEAVPQRWSCSSSAAGMNCSFDGVAQCELEQRTEVQEEICDRRQ